MHNYGGCVFSVKTPNTPEVDITDAKMLMLYKIFKIQTLINIVFTVTSVNSKPPPLTTTTQRVRALRLWR